MPDGLDQAVRIPGSAEAQGFIDECVRLSIQRLVDHGLYRVPHFKVSRIPHDANNLPRVCRHPLLVKAKSSAKGRVASKKTTGQDLIDNNNAWRSRQLRDFRSSRERSRLWPIGKNIQTIRLLKIASQDNRDSSSFEEARCDRVYIDIRLFVRLPLVALKLDRNAPT